MKNIIKTTAICILFAMMLTVCVSALDTSKDIFYFDRNDPRVREAVNSHVGAISMQDAEYYIKHEYLNGQEVDISKLSVDTSKLFAKHYWTSEQVIEFMKAEDKSAYLKTINPTNLFFRYYYDGKLIEDFYPRFVYDRSEKKYKAGVFGFTLEQLKGWHNIDVYMDKEELIKILEKDGITGYDIVYSLEVGYVPFVIAEKDGETFAIYMPVERFTSESELYNENKKALDGRVMTISQMETYFESYARIQAKNMAKGDSLDYEGGAYTAPKTESEPYVGGDSISVSVDISDTKPGKTASDDKSAQESETGATVTTGSAETVTDTAEAVPDAEIEKTDAPLAEDEPENKSPVIWIVLGAIVLIAAGAVTIALIKKKKA